MLFAENLQAIPQYGWEDHQSVAGVYAQHLTGQVLTFSMQYLYGADGKLADMVAAKTAIHFKLEHSAVTNGTAGMHIWSAYIQSMALVGSQGNPFSWALNGFSHNWSAFGNG